MTAQMMRQILIDHARKERAAKRGGLAITLALDEAPKPPILPRRSIST
jgi:hypothetical protein